MTQQPMHLAIQTPPENTTFVELRDTWQAADELGFRAAFTFDHFVPLDPGAKPSPTAAIPNGTQLEGWTTLAALAVCTSKMMVGTLVTGVTYRHPIVVAKMAVTLDKISGGRAILGIGAGWHEAEHRMYGIDYPTAGERMGRLDEALTIFHRLCTEDTVDFDGRWYQLAGAVFEPKPVHASGIPVLVGGSGDRLKRVAARHATMFNSFSPPWEWAAVNADLDVRLDAAGRSPADLERTAYVFAELSGERDRDDALVAMFQRNRGGTDDEVRRRVLVGDPDTMIAALRGYADAGVHTAIINLRPPYRTQKLETLARDVMPALL
jgi:alkanesulfonate monooxygenase SsuD/methylene tetrahydromethanopterin reductase-like flavin-dependent oxidoreductase (luciferase family)